MGITSKWLTEFESGRVSRAWNTLGGRLTPNGAEFRVWAPNAQGVSVVGEFNSWTPGSHPMQRIKGGIWELSIGGLTAGDPYKYAIDASDGQTHWKADPYALYSELRPGSASRLWDTDGYEWGDRDWLKYRRTHKVYGNPMNIYEVHLGSWRRGKDGAFLGYREFAHQLIPYVQSLGFTHIELMPVTEYPYDASWGYQCTGYFAATSRYGTPQDFMYFVDKCHKAGIGVIMDWVPAHFPKDPHGLVEFDGSRCYEYADPQKAEHPSWGTRIFDYAKGQVRSFLISSALFWLERYHVDGLRVDAVASMLYLDYDRDKYQWRQNIYGGRENLEAIEFMHMLNEAAFRFDDSILMIAEESTAWPYVTMPADMGGLGYNLKWNMGWMNDSLSYIETDPYFRSGCHNKLTFSLFYAFSENYVLPLSHDEVVHIKGSLYGKMPGDTQMKLAGIRAFWAYVLAHPGKKLMFMGAELGQSAEWDFAGELSWSELDDPGKTELHRFFKESGRFYLETPELWEIDFSGNGFRWICPDENECNIVAFIRYASDGSKLIFLCSFSGGWNRGFRFGLPEPGTYEIVFTTDKEELGGHGALSDGDRIRTSGKAWHGFADSAVIDLPPLTAVFMKISAQQQPSSPAR